MCCCAPRSQRTCGTLDVYKRQFQSPAVGDLSPAFAVGDGCDSVGGTYPLTVEFNGEQVNPVTTRYCSNVILAGTFNADLYAGRGTMMGEDGMWSGYMINYNLGNDLHRTPFGGRNFEYMSCLLYTSNSRLAA